MRSISPNEGDKNNAPQAIKVGVTPQPKLSQLTCLEFIAAKPQCIPPRNDNITAPYVISACTAKFLKGASRIIVRTASPQNGISPAMPRLRADIGILLSTFDCDVTNLANLFFIIFNLFALNLLRLSAT